MTNELFAIASEAYNRRNYRKALNLFLESANSEDADSMLMLGVIYGSGKGVEIDFKRSIEWGEKSVAAGSISAILNLGITYRTIGDLVKAKNWFEKSLDAGDVEAALHLAKIYMVRELEVEKMKKYLDIVIIGKDALEIKKTEAVELRKYLFK
ncbi:sel1 repeat family protein [Delftia acidovorans]|uniref:tetratricopeptide repeat protein n=1 Tax=Delftia acidovorans TaxID=80866 RepID=UPI0018E70F3E|nr:tetratricopeptide repeat protein [Delftia acidovorans]MBJ2140898.1 sel1 repeat family protein [Delftia acidovorans]